MKITFSKVAYVPCSAMVLDEITQTIGGIAEGERQVVVNYDFMVSWLTDTSNKEDSENLFVFLTDVWKELQVEINDKGDPIGEVIFSS